MLSEKITRTAAGLQHGLVDVQVQSVNALDVKGDLIFQQGTEILVYHGNELR